MPPKPAYVLQWPTLGSRVSGAPAQDTERIAAQRPLAPNP